MKKRIERRNTPAKLPKVPGAGHFCPIGPRVAKKRIAFGAKGFPWTFNKYTKKIKYVDGMCPVADDLQDNKYLGILLCSYVFDKQDIRNLINAFQKVWNNLESLK